jgi:hypothetical protein
MIDPRMRIGRLGRSPGEARFGDHVQPPDGRSVLRHRFVMDRKVVDEDGGARAHRLDQLEHRPALATPPQSAPEGGLVEGNTYTGELPVPGGGSVKLNGIVYSPDHPIAVLDGRVMGPGENVQGFTVVAIESGRVKLQGHGATVYLSPK